MYCPGEIINHSGKGFLHWKAVQIDFKNAILANGSYRIYTPSPGVFFGKNSGRSIYFKLQYFHSRGYISILQSPMWSVQESQSILCESSWPKYLEIAVPLNKETLILKTLRFFNHLVY